MNPDKFAEIQVQMKQNNHEYQNFLNDLDSWEKDVKQKEVELKKEPPTNQNPSLPPVRNSLDKKKKKKKKVKSDTAESSASSKKKKIKGFDYRSWDKFDVDAACEDVDKDSGKSSEDEYETDEEWENERKKLLAVQHKEQGNQYFKKGDYINAVESYTCGIESDPDNAVLPANRAMALLKQEKYGAAELDCTRSLTLDPSYIKAYHRRGTARAALKKYAEAKEDFLLVLKKEPNNKQAKQELEKVERLLNPPKLLQSKNLETSDIGIVTAVYKPPDQRSHKPLRRMVIEEIGEDEKDLQRKQRMRDAQETQSETKRTITAQDNMSFEKLINTDTYTNSNSSLKAAEDLEVSADGVKRLTIEEIENCDEENLSLENKTVFNGKTSQVSKENDKQIKKCVVSSDSSEKNEIKCDSGPRVPAVPASSYQFQADWKVLKNTTNEFYQYFKEIDPKHLSKLLGQFFDADLLSKILSTLQSFYIKFNIDPYPVLSNLCDVKRFSMTVMFMSKKKKVPTATLR